MDDQNRSLIINHPELVRPGQRLTAMGVTLFFWAMLLYLWQPLLSLVAWGFNIRLFYNHMIVLGGYRSFLDLLGFYAIVVAFLGGGLILWARINQWRFRGRDRRRGVTATDTGALCETFQVQPETLEQARGQSNLTVTLDRDGRVLQFEYGAVDKTYSPAEAHSENIS